MLNSRWRNSGGGIFPQLRLGIHGLSALPPRLTTSSRSRSFRAAWAEAEVVIPSMLAQGYHPLYLERMIEEELMHSPRSAYSHEFFLACRRILANLRRANQFIGLPSLGEYEELCVVRNQLLGFECMMYRRYSGLSSGGRSMMVDSETEVELARSRALDRDVEAELTNIREREIHSQTQRYQGNEASLRQLQNELADARFRAETAEAQLDLRSGGGSRNGSSRVSGGSSTYISRHSAPTPRRLESRSGPFQHSANYLRTRQVGSNDSTDVRGREVVQYHPPQPTRSAVDTRSMTSTLTSPDRGQRESQYTSSSWESVRTAYTVNHLPSDLTSRRVRDPTMPVAEQLRSRNGPSTATRSIATSPRSGRDDGRSYAEQSGARSRHHQTQNGRNVHLDGGSRSVSTTASVSDRPIITTRQNFPYQYRTDYK